METFADKREANEVATMTKMKMMSEIMFALPMTAPPAMALTSAHDVSIPSAHNSEAGIAGLPGDEDGAAVQRKPAVGFSAAMRPHDASVREQDAANIPGLPGTEPARL